MITPPRRKGLTVRFARRMEHPYPRAIALYDHPLMAGVLTSIISHRYPLADTPAAFDVVMNYRDRGIKAIVVPYPPRSLRCFAHGTVGLDFESSIKHPIFMSENSEPQPLLVFRESVDAPEVPAQEMQSLFATRLARSPNKVIPLPGETSSTAR